MAALERGSPPSLGCYDLVLHQTAIYDFISSWILFGVLLYIGRRVHKAGTLALTFGLWYGGMRIVTDTLRVDKRYFGLTGSQITALVVMTISAYLLVRYRGAPPRYASPPPSDREGPGPDGQRPATESDDEGPEVPSQASGEREP